MNDIQVSKNFKLREFECRDGSHLVKLDERLLEKLQKMRDIIKKPIIVHSGYRTPEYNKKVGGAPRSQHLEGKAADIKVSGMNPHEVAKFAKEVGFNGIGIYTHNGNWFTHVDVRDTKSYWIDGSGGQLYSVPNI